MNAIDILKSQHATTNMVVQSYLGDLDDADLLVRPADGCNHIAYQLGHLITSNAMLIGMSGLGTPPTLPDGFEDQYTPETSASDDPKDFLSKAEYLELLEAGGAAFLAALDAATPEALDGPTPEQFQSFVPTIGGLLGLIATHGLMHCGQWVPVRRQLGKPVVI